MKIVHIIPTYNEKDNIKNMIDEIFLIGRKNKNWDNSVLVVDDCSPDGTSEIVKRIQKTNKNVFLLNKNKEGLGKALIMGYSYAIHKLNADVIIPNDADFQWDPKDYPKLLEGIEKGYDVVVASRHVKNGGVIGWNWFRKLNHDVSNVILARYIAGVKEVKDHAGNFKAIRVKDVLGKVNLEKMMNAGFSFQLHILYELSKVTKKFYEVGVLFKERRFGKSKIGFNKYYIRDVFEYTKSSLIIRLQRSPNFFKYLIVGMFGFIIQTLLSKIGIALYLNPGLAVSIGAEGSIISNFLFNNFWTFSSTKNNLKSMLEKFIKFNLVSLVSIMIQGVVVHIGTSLFGIQTWFYFMVFSIIFIVIPYSYFAYNKFIWPKKK